MALDWISPTLDGSELALMRMAVALARIIPVYRYHDLSFVPVPGSLALPGYHSSPRDAECDKARTCLALGVSALDPRLCKISNCKI